MDPSRQRAFPAVARAGISLRTLSVKIFYPRGEISMMRFHPSISGLAGYGIALCCSLSTLALPDLSLAQTTPAHSCITQERSVSGVITIGTDDCEHDIRLTGRQSDSDDNCNQVSRTLEAGEDWRTNADHLPSKICIEYAALARQNEAGYQACSSISDSIADCGSNMSGIIFVVPLALSSTRISLSTTSITIDEGTSQTFTARLDSQPFADTTLSLSSTNPDTTLSSTTLTFTTTNWDQAQTLTLTLARDEDSTDDEDTITVTSSDGFIPFTTIAVAVEDQDITPTGNIVLSTQSLDLEEHRRKTFTVRLDNRPDANVTVTLSSTNPDLLLPNSLTFTTSNWNQTQNVSIGPRPDYDDVDETATLTLAASGGIEAPNATIAVTIDDNNDRTIAAHTCIANSGYRFSDVTMLVGNNLSSGVYPCGPFIIGLVGMQTPAGKSCETFSHDIEPGFSVFVGIPARLCFEFQDSLTQAALGYQGCDSVSITDCGEGGPGVEALEIVVPLRLVPGGTLVLSPTGTLTIDEGETGTLSVSLSVEPVAQATVTLSKTDADITLSETSLTFTPSNWNTAQSVTITTVQDNDTNDASDTITLTADSKGINAPTATKAITVNDTTPTGTISLDPAGTLTIDEGETGTFDVSLSVKPQTNVVISLSKTGSDIMISHTSLTFTPSNWNTAQSITVTTVQDNDTDDASGTVSLTMTSGGFIAPDASLTIAIDDTTPTGTISLDPAGTLTIDEGETGTFDVSLSVKPQTNVVISLSKTGSDITISHTSLTFTPSNWNTAQSVTVTTVQDNDTDDASGTVSLTRTSGGFIAPDASLAIAIDDTTPTGTISLDPAGTLTIDEGETGTFDVSLSVKPQTDVVISLSKTDSDTTISHTSLTFTPSNWNAAQTVSLSTVRDDDTNDASDTVTLVVASGGFKAPDASLAVTIDDTTPTGRILLNPAQTLTIDEGETGSFDVSLSVKPQTDVGITLSKTDSDTTISHTSLTFTPSNWNAVQTVTLSTVRDNDIEDASDSIALVVASGGFKAPDASLAVTIDDTTPRGRIVLTPGETFSVNEGGAGSFGVSLDAKPQTNVGITLSKTTNPDITISETSLTFTPSNWDTAQNVIVSAETDSDTTDDFDTVTLAVASGGFSASNARLRIRVSDVPAGAIAVTPTGIIVVDEDNSTTFLVKLGIRVQPSTDITVTLSKTNPDITLSETSLTFTPSNWQEEQSVGISASPDSDTVNDSDTITLAATSGIDTRDTTKGVSVIDDDRLGTFVLSTDRLIVVEGQDATFGIELGTAPSVPSITVSLSNTTSQLSFSPSSLTFTPDDFDERQDINVYAQQDENTNDGSDTITLSASGGGNYEGIEAELPAFIFDTPGEFSTSIETIGLIEGGAPVSFSVTLEVEPVNTDIVVVSLSSTNTDITLSPSSLLFTRSIWSTPQSVVIAVADDANLDDELDTITLIATGGNYDGATGTIEVTIEDDDDDAPPVDIPEQVKGYALAIPPDTASDRSELRIRCRQNTPCTVYLHCSAQNDGSIFEGWLPGSIPGWGTQTLIASDIVHHTGGSWSGKGRLGCALRSEHTISTQIWTRSGDGVLVNNSAIIRSAFLNDGYRADIESIPSPDGSDGSNIRIRCIAPSEAHCTGVAFSCFEDDGTGHDGVLGTIERLTTRHLQADELADIIDHRWEGIDLSCELRSDHPFTVQILTRTGGGGALVNNSATGRPG